MMFIKKKELAGRGRVEVGEGAVRSRSCWLALVIAAIVAMGLSGEALGQSCVGNCGEFLGSCSCNPDCAAPGECCEDFCEACGAEFPSVCGACCFGQTCAHRTQGQCDVQGGAYQGHGTSCSTYPCGPPPGPGTCEGNCGGSGGGSPPCSCDSSCCDFEDCCEDKCEHCGDGFGNCDNVGECIAAPPPPACGDPEAGDCCDLAGTGSPNCDDLDCCDLICTTDAFCCDTSWDGVCAGLANEHCAVCQPPPPPALAVKPNPAAPGMCYQIASTVTVVVEMRDMVDVVVGGQYLLLYDDSVLEFVSASPADPVLDAPSPFTLEVIAPIVDSGLIIYATGVDVLGGPPGTGGTDGDAVMARLTFTTLVDDVCAEGDLVTIAPGTLLCDDVGQAVLGVTFEDLPAITVDSTPPDLSVPADVVIECDVAGDWYAGTGDCAGMCGGPSGTGCSCDNGCAGFGDCCPGVCSDCPGLNHCSGMASATDNCDPDPVVTYTDTLVPGSCPQEFTIEREWTATDCSGNVTVALQTISIVDTTPPVVDAGSVPSDIVAYSDAGVCGAVVSWTPPTATDNCSAPGGVTVTSSHQPGDFFAVGPHVVTYWFEDECGNESDVSFNVEVLGVSQFAVTVQLFGVTADVNRCTTFEFSGVDSDSVSAVLAYVQGTATATLEVACGNYDCIAARDSLHTLTRTQTPGTGSAGEYTADFTGADFALIGGDLNDDNVVDILDFGVFVWQYSSNYGSGDTTCATPYPHADLSGDGMVHGPDFSFIQIHFLELGDMCSSNMMGGDGFAQTPRPLRRISVSELRRRGFGHLAIADLNQDGWLDETDIVLWLSGKRP